MQLLVYILVYPLLFLISILPFRLLYLLSDLTFFLVYYIVGYRKTVVTENLKLVFPEKSESEINRIKKKFYRHLCDLIMEMIKSITISQAALIKRFKVANPELLNSLEDRHSSLIMMYGHYASYEWSIVIGQYIRFKGYGVYKPLRNKYFNRLVKRIRSKFNLGLISSKQAKVIISKLVQSGEPVIVGLVSDQSPKAVKKYPLIDFMGHSVPCFTGAETMAKQFDIPLCYIKIDKLRRGHYQAEFIILAEEPNKYPDYQLTEKFTRILEDQIREAPEYYLWTHKRWKHRIKK
ncbi:MAG: lipid A biosynthesis acyltransferase [Flavobacteriaceae bacterium]|nr:lipid A biosynthesis acyltransferase [Flavobacteriaceae bacterium]NNK69377.1 lipid A biosynthesis acyltransferase [Flavobacteriaceae bacterium]NNL80075.1 lipid A biosynthesis acyltransferase [Flavobacteriaceae bacterium]